MGSVFDHLQIVDENCPWKVGSEMSPTAVQDFLESFRTEEGLEHFVQWPHSFLHKAMSHFRALGRDRYMNGQQLKEALWRTSIGDNDELSFPAHPRILPAFEAHEAAYRYRGRESLSAREEQQYAHLENLSDIELLSNSQRISELLSRRGQGRQLAITRTGYLALVPDRAKEGDAVCIFRGAKVPYVLRKKEEEGFELVGEAYVHGLMDGLVFEYTMERDCSWVTLV
jgi:hypothetical protein